MTTRQTKSEAGGQLEADASPTSDAPAVTGSTKSSLPPAIRSVTGGVKPEHLRCWKIVPLALDLDQQASHRIFDLLDGFGVDNLQLEEGAIKTRKRGATPLAITPEASEAIASILEEDVTDGLSGAAGAAEAWLNGGYKNARRDLTIRIPAVLLPRDGSSWGGPSGGSYRASSQRIIALLLDYIEQGYLTPDDGE